MAEIRDPNEVQAEIVAEWTHAVASATNTAAGQQQQSAAWIDGGLPEGNAVTPGPGGPSRVGRAGVNVALTRRRLVWTGSDGR